MEIFSSSPVLTGWRQAIAGVDFGDELERKTFGFTFQFILLASDASASINPSNRHQYAQF